MAEDDGSSQNQASAVDGRRTAGLPGLGYGREDERGERMRGVRLQGSRNPIHAGEMGCVGQLGWADQCCHSSSVFACETKAVRTHFGPNMMDVQLSTDYQHRKMITILPFKLFFDNTSI